MRSLLTRISLSTTLSIFLANSAVATPQDLNVNCADIHTFSFGQIIVKDLGEQLEVLLRGYRTHGRAAEDLLRDVNLETDPTNFGPWVGATFKKSKCQVKEGIDPAITCYSKEEEGELTVYKGYRPEELEVIHHVKGSLTFALEQLQVQSSSELVAKTRGSIELTSADLNLYRSNVTVEFNTDSCRRNEGN